MRPAGAADPADEAAAPREPNEGVALAGLFDARRWVIVGHGADALARGAACLAADPSVEQTAIELASGRAAEALRLLSPREPVLVVIDRGADWVRLAEILAALKVHHGPAVLLLPETPAPAARSLLDALHERGGRLLRVQVGDDTGTAVVLRHVRTALAGTATRPDPARTRHLAPGPTVTVGGPPAPAASAWPRVTARLPLALPAQPRAVERLVAAASDLAPVPDRPGPFVGLRPGAMDGAALATRVLELLVQGVLPVLPASTLDALPLSSGVAAGLRRTLPRPAGPWSAERDSVRLRRAVLRDHTIVGELASRRTVTIVLVTRRPAFLTHALEQVVRQRHPRLELVLVGHGIDPVPAIEERHRSGPVALRTAQLPPERSLGDGLQLATELATGELVLKMDDDDWYGPDLVGDLVMALEVSGAELVGAAMDFVYLASLGVTIRRGAPSERFGSHVSGATLLLRRDDLLTLGGWPRVARAVDTRLLDAVRVAGGAHYATHGFGYLVHRHLDGNTFAADDAWFLSGCAEQWPGLALHAADVAPGQEHP